jgi:hypothetical protein
MKRVTPVKDDWFLNHGRHGNVRGKRTVEDVIRRWMQIGADF